MQGVLIYLGSINTLEFHAPHLNMSKYGLSKNTSARETLRNIAAYRLQFSSVTLFLRTSPIYQTSFRHFTGFTKLLFFFQTQIVKCKCIISKIFFIIH